MAGLKETCEYLANTRIHMTRTRAWWQARLFYRYSGVAWGLLDASEHVSNPEEIESILGTARFWAEKARECRVKAVEAGMKG